MGTGMSFSAGAIADARIERLIQRQARAAAFEPNSRWYNLMVAPPCPPDKRLYIRNGIVSPSAQWGFIMQDDFIPDTACDFENQGETQMALNFTNAGYYLGLILCYYGDWAANQSLGAAYAEPIFDNVIGTEVATAAEAEAEVDAFLNGDTQWYNYRVPLWGIVLKNDGVTGVDYSILPVDIVNRGRSYMYRDARARHNIFS